MKQLATLSGDLSLPTFFPDGTVGVVRSVDSQDLKNAGVEGVVTSTFHLLVHDVNINLHELMSWDRPILTDSGGFQVFSLLRDNPKLGKVSDDGFLFTWNGRKIKFTPEESIRKQLELGADILVCLDQCTDPGKDLEFQEEAVRITIDWAKRCKEEFEKEWKIDNGKLTMEKRPKLFAVVQGGDNKELREYCAKELIKIGFDGYCYGGVPVDEKRVLLEDILEFTAKCMPDDKPKYALGVGKPEDIVKCAAMGYTIFDCVIPTREARHKKIYSFKKGFKNLDPEGKFYQTYTLNTAFEKDSKPLGEGCDCLTCQNYSRSYIYHLFKVGDTLAYRLATIHNLRFYCEVVKLLA